MVSSSKLKSSDSSEFGDIWGVYLAVQINTVQYKLKTVRPIKVSPPHTQKEKLRSFLPDNYLPGLCR